MCAHGRARHRPRHPAARPASGPARSRPAARGGQGARAGPAAADRDQGELPLDRAPAQLPGLRRGEAAVAGGEVAGEYRFLGLYTHAAFSESIKGIPVLRRKLAEVLALSGMAADSHDGKEVAEVLDFYPREELFMTSVADLAAITAGVHVLRERRQTRLFLRKDIYGRYVSCLVYLPRDRYTTQVRLRAQEILQRAFGAASQVDYSVQVGESSVARLHLVVRADRGRQLPDADPLELERAVAAAVRSWDDDLADEAATAFGAAAGQGAAHPDRRRDPGHLQDRRARRRPPSPTSPGSWSCARPAATSTSSCGSRRTTSAACRSSRTTTCRTTRQAGLAADDLPDRRPDHADRRAAAAAAHGRRRDRRASVRVPGCRSRSGSMTSACAAGRCSRRREAAAGRPDLQPARPGAGRGGAAGAVGRPDRGRRLQRAGARRAADLASGRGAARLRQVPAAGQHHLQPGLHRRRAAPNAPIARLLVTLFESRFDPAKQAGEAERSEAITEEITGALDNVASLDEDRILRSYLGLITATLRTNYYSTGFGRRSATWCSS